MSSISPYATLRKAAANKHIDWVTVEHRGVGLSRKDTSGADPKVSDVTLTAAADDLAAALDAEGVAKATVYGASYGTFLAQIFAVRHPERVNALVLDSPMLDPQDDLAMARAYRRQLLWDGTIEETRELTPKIRKLAEIYPQAELAHVVQVVYEFAGSQALSDLADAWRAGRMLRLWKWLATLGSDEVEGAGTPFLVEPDLVQGISFGEAGYGLAPDGGPLDPQLFFVDAASRMLPYTGPPVDLRKATKNYRFPVLVLSGARDLRTSLPVAQRLADLIPDAYLAIHPDHGHSFLDTHPFFALQVVDLVRSGNIQAVAGHMDALRTIRQPAMPQLLWRVLAGSAWISRLKMGY